MKTTVTLILAGLLASVPARAETIQLGKFEFLADTNVKMFRFKGEAKELQGKIERSGTRLKTLEIRVPVHSFKTGMDIRDKHTIERVFTAPDGSTPDIVFTSAQSVCKAGASASEQNCELAGTLAFRGQSQPFNLSVSFRNDSLVEGHTVINVLQFGVTPQALSYTSIAVDPKVAVNFEVKLQ